MGVINKSFRFTNTVSKCRLSKLNLKGTNHLQNDKKILYFTFTWNNHLEQYFTVIYLTIRHLRMYEHSKIYRLIKIDRIVDGRTRNEPESLFSSVISEVESFTPSLIMTRPLFI